MNGRYVFIPSETCRKYLGKFVALDPWVNAGVIASGADMLELETKLAKRGALFGDVIILFVASAQVKHQVYVV